MVPILIDDSKFGPATYNAVKSLQRKTWINKRWNCWKKYLGCSWKTSLKKRVIAQIILNY
ncbi:hypothetical protein BGT94_00855 [Clostridioides difficile]|nr:hypothetical protein BGU40_03315 [Clostridioides difficile]PBH76220.1 hypothetical protein BGT94_00855 [Clostridioides difficile]